jgi:hypothetical protein
MAKMADLNARGITKLYDYTEGIQDGMLRVLKILASREAEPYLGVGYDLEGLAEVILEEENQNGPA